VQYQTKQNDEEKETKIASLLVHLVFAVAIHGHMHIIMHIHISQAMISREDTLQMRMHT